MECGSYSASLPEKSCPAADGSPLISTSFFTRPTGGKSCTSPDILYSRDGLHALSKENIHKLALNKEGLVFCSRDNLQRAPAGAGRDHQAGSRDLAGSRDCFTRDMYNASRTACARPLTPQTRYIPESLLQPGSASPSELASSLDLADPRQGYHGNTGRCHSNESGVASGHGSTPPESETDLLARNLHREPWTGSEDSLLRVKTRQVRFQKLNNDSYV